MSDVPFYWRLRLVLFAALGLWGLVACSQRLYQLQVVEGAVYNHRAIRNTVVLQPIPPPRGRIVDSHGHILASNEPRYAVTLTPGECSNIPDTIRQLSEALGVSPVRLQHKLGHTDPMLPVVLMHSLTSEQVAHVAGFKAPGLQLQVRPQRRYPYGTLASHELGYVGDISAEDYARRRHNGYGPNDTVGQSGLEQHYDRWLHGKAGSQRASVDPVGRFQHVEAGTAPTPGGDLHLSVSLKFQQFAEKRLQATLDQLRQANGETTAGAVVVMEARTGRILAMASLPDFDPRWFARGITDKEYRHLMQDPMRPLLSRAFQAAYPPGSTFKLVNAAASLQSGICTLGTIFYCSGEYKGFHCFDRGGHGSLNFTETLAQSCDVTYYRLGDILGIKRLSHFAQLFGLGKRTGVDLADEDTGLFATPKWKKSTFKQDWQYYDTINMSIGQGMTEASPLQMAVVVAAVANGGYIVRPHLVDTITSGHKKLWTYPAHPLYRVPVKREYLAAIRKGMEAVVDHGTAAGAQSKLVRMAGKTGTAEAVPTVDNPHGRNHTWFVSYAPAERPRIVTVVLVVKAGGYGGGVAAPIARDCIDYWYTHERKP